MLLWADSFEHYGLTPNGGRDTMLDGAWSGFVGFSDQIPRLSSTHARTGTTALYFPKNTTTSSGNKSRARRVVGTATNVAGVGFGLFMDNLPGVSKRIGFGFRDAANARVVAIYFEPDGSLTIYGPDDTLIDQTTPRLVSNAFDHLECKCVFDDVVGSVEIRVNGVVASLITDVDTGTSVSIVEWGDMQDGGTSGGQPDTPFYIDDVVCWNDEGDFNTDFLGPVRVTTYYPLADSSPFEWDIVGVASGGDGVDAVNETTPDDDATYIEAATSGTVAQFTLNEVPPETLSIAGVYIPARAKLDEAGTGNLQVSIISDGQTADGDVIPLSPQYTYRGTVFESDPGSGSPLEAWTRETLNAAVLQVAKVDD